MSPKSPDSYPRIRDYFENKTVFMTGGSGFIGTVLIEKLLRSCPEIKKIYVLLRPKKGLSIEERKDKIFCPNLFAKLDKQTNGAWKKKIEFIDGDVRQLNLGISEENEKTLIKEVNIFYHNAASVRFDESLKSAIIMNARGTREACQLALKMKKIEMFCHVSTTYCNLHRPITYEEIFPPVANWKEMLYLAENMDEFELQQISTKMMDYHFPNTYTFSKHLGEQIVNDMCDGKVPTIVIRPSILYSTRCDPIKGWTDNFNGPVGMFAASAKGIMRINWATKDNRMDLVPVDFAVKFIIIMTYYRRTRENEESLKRLKVYNASADLQYAVTIEHLMKLGLEVVDDIPVTNPLWYPLSWITPSKLSFFIQFILVQLIPAVIIDGLLKLSGNKPRLVKIQKKIYVASFVVNYFFNKEWKFVNDTLISITSKLRKDDLHDFSYNLNMDHKQVFIDCAIGGKMYLLKDDMENMDKDKRRMKQMKILHYTTKTLFYAVLLYFAYSHLYILNNVLQFVLKIFVY